MGVNLKIGVYTPKSSILIGFSLIFTIHFGVFPSIFGNAHISRKGQPYFQENYVANLFSIIYNDRFGASPNMSNIFPRRDEIKKKAPKSGAMECEQLRSFPLPETNSEFAPENKLFAPKGNYSSNHPFSGANCYLLSQWLTF